MLKRKKQIDSQIEKLRMARSNIDNVISAIEAASTNMLALNTMRIGTQTLQQMTRSMYERLLLISMGLDMLMAIV